MKRTPDEVKAKLHEMGYRPGVYVSFETVLGHQRYGCIMAVKGDGNCELQCSNARFDKPAMGLKIEPDLQDVIAADQRAIYGL